MHFRRYYAWPALIEYGNTKIKFSIYSGCLGVITLTETFETL